MMLCMGIGCCELCIEFMLYVYMLDVVNFVLVLCCIYARCCELYISCELCIIGTKVFPLVLDHANGTNVWHL